MNHTEQRNADLAEILESSVQAAQTKGQFVASWELPHDHDLVDVHSMLERVIRSQRRIRGQWVLPMLGDAT